ncbi:hypothetical protein [Achromobacter xylosoxidans]|uniref:hypothetical protein n=1 Tax=Alcaligenes xylosoxydans xylosoxydans TaxID=85698 RepID=UPI001F13A812|nr:hypothetical protein [Achromobacter xylosoxidans]
MTYHLVARFDGVLRITPEHGRQFIPNDPANVDWIDFCEWESAGGIPAPADERPTAIRAVTAAQGGIALIRAGLMGAVTAAAMDAGTPAEVRWAFEKATEWSLDSDTFAYLAAKAGISKEQSETLFTEAAAITA